MSDYIKRILAKAEFTGNFQDAYPTAQIHAYIDGIPAADVRENVHGKWEDTDNGLFRCSICKKECLFMADKRFGKAYPYLSEYCAFCGAELEVVEDYGEEAEP